MKNCKINYLPQNINIYPEKRWRTRIQNCNIMVLLLFGYSSHFITIFNIWFDMGVHECKCESNTFINVCHNIIVILLYYSQTEIKQRWSTIPSISTIWRKHTHKIQLSREWGNLINRFNPTIILCLSQTMSWVSITTCLGLFCIQWLLFVLLILIELLTITV